MSNRIEIDGIEMIKHCGYCDCIIYAYDNICSFCKKDLTPMISEKLSHKTLIEVEKLINDALFRLENFMNGTLSDYKYFGFSDFFTKLFFEGKKLENFTIENCNFISNYQSLICQISYDFDKGDFENNDAFDNDDFCKDCNEISVLANHCFHEFYVFFSHDEKAEVSKPAKLSITNIQRSKADTQPPAIDFIFNNKTNAYEVFKGLLEDLEIVVDGKAKIKKGRVGKLTGLITAIKETPHMLKIQNPTDKQLLEYLNNFLKTSYKTFSKRNDDYLPSVDDAKRYIKNHFKK